MIRVSCPGCQVKYKVPDEAAGKHVKCRQCGARISIPAGMASAQGAQVRPMAPSAAAPGGPGATIDLSLLMSLEDTTQAGPPEAAQDPWEAMLNAPVSGGAGGAGPRAPRPVSPKSAAPAPTGAAQPRHPVAPVTSGPRQVRAYNAILDQYLPIALILVGYGSILLSIYQAEARPNMPTNIKMGILGMVALFVAAYVLVIVPVTSLGPRYTAKLLRFELPDSILFRTHAIFALPFALVAVINMFTFNQLLSSMIALLLLMPLAFLLIWGLFHMKFVEAMVGFVFTGLAFGGSLALLVGLFVGGAWFYAANTRPSRPSSMAGGSAWVDPRAPIARDDGGPPATSPYSRRPRANAQPYTPPPPRILLEDLRSVDTAIRGSALSKVIRDPLPPEVDRQQVIATVTLMLDDPNNYIQAQAIKALVQLEREQAVPAIVLRLESDDYGVRAAAIEALGLLKDPRAIEPLTRLLDKHGDQAAPALIAYGGDAEPAVLAVLETLNDQGRRSALQVLAKVGSNKSLGAARKFARDQDRQVASAARELWRKLAPKEFDAITEALLTVSSGNSSEQKKAFEQLASMEVDQNRRGQVARTLEQQVAQTYYAEQLAAALLVWKDDKTVPNLLAHLKQGGDAQARQGAMKALAAIKDPKAVYPIVQWLILDRYHARNALVEMGSMVEDEVAKLLTNANESAAREAATILGEVGTSKSMRALALAIANTRRPSVAAAAREAVDKIKARQASAG
ncbi:MAG: HEAT repeat domain-containing protein [Phycisphaeraceae bacterium]